MAPYRFLCNVSLNDGSAWYCFWEIDSSIHIEWEKTTTSHIKERNRVETDRQGRKLAHMMSRRQFLLLTIALSKTSAKYWSTANRTQFLMFLSWFLTSTWWFWGFMNTRRFRTYCRPHLWWSETTCLEGSLGLDSQIPLGMWEAGANLQLMGMLTATPKLEMDINRYNLWSGTVFLQLAISSFIHPMIK
jgi:hypothetical protein